jgi:hypothetical protein
MRGAWIWALVMACAAGAAAQEGAGGQAISREEYEALRKEVQSLRKELAEVKAGNESHRQEVEQAVNEIAEEAQRAQEMAEARRSGLATFLLTGNATISYVDRDGSASTFRAVWRPVFLWKLNDRMLFEGKLELRLEDDVEDIEARIEYANLTYIVNDYLTIGAGKVLTPFGLYPERFYPGKLVDDPLAFADNGLAPHSSLGFFARGAFPVGSTEWNYAAYAVNGPELRTDSTRAGLLNFSNSIDDNDNKAAGARVGFLPWHWLEVGYSVYYGEAQAAGEGRIGALLQGVDLHYYDEVPWLKGTMDVRAEWVWSNVDERTFDPGGAEGFGPLRFDNKRQGGYVEAAYRPTGFDLDVLRKTEWVIRWDYLDAPSSAPGAGDQRRWTAALLYWITPTTAVRGGYVWDRRERGQDADGWFMQLSVGF